MYSHSLFADMTILSVIGGHDREAIQTFLNVVLSVGGNYNVLKIKLTSLAFCSGVRRY